MFGQGIRNHLITAILAVAAGGAVGSGATYVVTTTPEPHAGGTTTAIPPRFDVLTDSRYPQFHCDLTLSREAMCRSDPDFRTMVQHQIVLKVHPGDPTRISVGAFGTRVDGITWSELAKGVIVGTTTVRATVSK